jgi:8-amino-7-oxononanoate synthase
MGTFSKICGGIGGFVVGDADLIEWLRFFARSHMFSVSIPPSTAAAALAALKIFQTDRSYLENLRSNIMHFISNLKQLGYKGLENHESAVVPVVIGNEEKLGKMYQSLLDDGVFVTPIVYPAVSRSNSRFRFTIMANHSIADLDFATNSLEKAMAKADFSFNE